MVIVKNTMRKKPQYFTVKQYLSNIKYSLIRDGEPLFKRLLADINKVAFDDLMKFGKESGSKALKARLMDKRDGLEPRGIIQSHVDALEVRQEVILLPVIKILDLFNEPSKKEKDDKRSILTIFNTDNVADDQSESDKLSKLNTGNYDDASGQEAWAKYYEGYAGLD